MARKGKHIELRPQHINIHELELLSTELPDISLKVKCSKGTYIRSLAHDLGLALNSGGHLTALRRTSIGPYSVSEALTLEKFIENLKLL
jgi:tRNA pseudouridine55 synthase